MARPATPLLTVDIIIELRDRPEAPIVLIERKNDPLAWALPGGFVDRGETTEQAAVREAREETGLTVSLQVLLGCYSDPGRDLREHTASVVYVARAGGAPCAGSDARALGVFTPPAWPHVLAFDHARILADYVVYRDTGRFPVPRP